MSINFCERQGVVEQEMREVICASPKTASVPIAVIGIGLEMHFDWAKAKASYRSALDDLHNVSTDSNTLIYQDTPVQTKEELLALLNDYEAQGMRGLVIYQASFIAGELAMALATWLRDHDMPVLSWSHTELTGGNLTANRLCGQNFLLNILSSMSVKYSWVFQSPGEPSLHKVLDRFLRVSSAIARLKYGKLLMIGGMRVPGFYDCELNEFSIAKHFGLSIERTDLETIWEHGEKFTDEDIAKVAQALVNSGRCAKNEVNERELNLSIRFSLAIADYANAGNYLGVALKNWPELFDRYGIAGDGAGALVQDQGIPIADESDMGGLLTMVAMNELTLGTGLPTLMDLSHLDTEDNKVGMWHCGGTATKLLREGCQFEVRNHSILDNFSPEESCGMLLEFLQELGPVTIAKYQSPHADNMFAFEGDIVDAPLRYRGSYGEVAPIDVDAKSISHTLLSNGLDHHWIMGRGHLLDDLREFNHWIGVQELEAMPSTTSGRSVPKKI